MKIKTVKKVTAWTLSVTLFLVLVLIVHIWWAYRPKPPGPDTKVMARIDLKQSISQADAGKIATWMYHQKGIDHVLVNPDTRIVIFTFYPVKASGNEIVKNFNADLPYKGNRFMPTEKQLASSCPVAGSSFYYKVYKFVDNIL
jgi:hypothetical protein